MVTSVTTTNKTSVSWWAKLSLIKKVLIVGWLTAILAEAVALGTGNTTLFVMGWVVSCMAGIGTVAARKHGRI